MTVTRHDVTELVQLRQMRKVFSHSLIECQDEERRRVARDVHDSTMQSLIALGLSLGQIKRTFTPEETAGVVGEMERILAETQREVSAISFLLHPPALEEMGLAAALEALVEGFRKRARLTVSINIKGHANFGWRAAEVAVYRMVQEALSNVY